MSEKVYEIGAVIHWQVGNIPAKGIVRDDNGGEIIEVISFEVNGRSCKTKIKLERRCIITE